MTAAQPAGTVTLVFTDIEGSTRLLHELGQEAYREALAEHRRVLREAFAQGYEVDYEGDAFFYSFASARGALQAVGEAMRALAGGPIRIRVGMHTGEPGLDPPKYVGLDVHKAARIMSAGHGGQVLVSEATRSLAGEELELLDLGPQRLKDLTAAERLYQLAGEGLERDFPPLKTLENRPTNLPVQPTAFLGREREISEVMSLLRRPDVRLLTLTGTGGTGKTRLALQAGAELVEEFPGGVYFVNLAALTDPALVLPTIAQTLGVQERPDEPLSETLAAYFRERELLLLLDNFEQVAEAALAVAAVLGAAPTVKALVTSRAPLHLAAEREFPVAPLAEEEALHLFLERAQAVRPDFTVDGNRPQLAEICRRLDYLPLAIELAAARVKLLPPGALLERLDARLKLLTGGARDRDERQRTLRAAIDWSHTLLTPDEQVLFRRLAVFAGGRTLEAIEEVCNSEGELDVFEAVASLVDKSLLRQEELEGAEPRFVMLETIHEYARERLDGAGETEDVSRRHAAYFLRLAEKAKPELDTADSPRWLARLEAEHDNFRSALAWLASDGDREIGLRLAAALWKFWQLHGHLVEGRGWLESVLARAGEGIGKAREDALKGLSAIAAFSGDPVAALTASEQGLALARARGDVQQVASFLNSVAVDLKNLGHVERARAALEESLSLARDAELQVDEANSLLNLASLCIETGAPDEASDRAAEALAIYGRLGDLEGKLIALHALAVVELERREWQRARIGFADSLDVANRARVGHRRGLRARRPGGSVAC